MTTWRKSSHSGTQGGSECVEVGRFPDSIGVRDSKNPDGPELRITRETFRTLMAGLKR
ncbi:DUF397 domain-containing protein [Actinomadura sp. 7K534]|uniref:DUF397 domain-containing protein n=1 Tax=Actinomadura sp. 7K534 TaxID=2530366 RepID=UPI00104C884B|nr:DUF397 domain-containing protein [Actinomadura sp. 7K534]TDB93107.1 DUF397 domain-containing protein [Actinomadura sp. 7K534]